jgi:putative ABC transport system permease protein
MGSLFGSLLAYGLLYLFHNYIVVILKLPYLALDIKSSFAIVAASLILSLLTGIMSSLYAAVKVGRTQVYLLIKESE